MFDNKIFLDISTESNKMAIFKYLASQKDGVISDLSIPVRFGDNGAKGIPLSSISNSELKRMVDHNTKFEIFNDTSLFMLDFIEESFEKEFVLVNESYFILNPSNEWTIKGNIFNATLALALNSHVCLDAVNVTLSANEFSEFQFNVLNTNQGQMEMVAADCGITNMNCATQTLTILGELNY